MELGERAIVFRGFFSYKKEHLNPPHDSIGWERESESESLMCNREQAPCRESHVCIYLYSAIWSWWSSSLCWLPKPKSTLV